MSAPEGAESCGPRRQPWDNRRGCSSPGRGDRRSTDCFRRNSVAPTGLAGNPTPRPTACAVGQSLARLRRSLWWKVPSLCRFMNNPGEAVPKWAAVISSTTLPPRLRSGQAPARSGASAERQKTAWSCSYLSERYRPKSAAAAPLPFDFAPFDCAQGRQDKLGPEPVPSAVEGAVRKKSSSPRLSARLNLAYS